MVKNLRQATDFLFRWKDVTKQTGIVLMTFKLLLHLKNWTWQKSLNTSLCQNMQPAVFHTFPFFSHFYCQLTIQGPPDKKIQLVINNLDISDSNDHGESFLQVIDGILGVSGKNLGGNQCFIISIISFSTHFQKLKRTINLWKYQGVKNHFGCLHPNLAWNHTWMVRI